MIIRAIAYCALQLLFLVPASAFAQQGGGLVQVITVSVRPGANAQFEEYARAVVEAASRQDVDSWLAAQSVSGKPTYTFTVQRGGWAGVGAPGPQLVEAFDEAEAARLYELAQSSIESVHTAFYQTRADLSVVPPEQVATPDAVVYSHITLNPGMLAQYVDGAQKTRVASAALLPDAYYVVQLPSFGATGVRVVGLVASWSNLDTPLPSPGQRVIQHYGAEEGGNITAMAIEAISNIEVVLNRTRPDLSYQPD